MNTPKRVVLMVVTFLVVVGLVEFVLLQIGHVELPLPTGGDDAGTATGSAAGD